VSRAVLSLGSNLGDRYGYLRQAVSGVGERLLVVSGVYETPPWPPGTEAPAYLNAALLAVDAGGPGAGPELWLALARELEAAAGRRRPVGDRYPPRTLDVDVIMVWDDADQPVMRDDPELSLPHPRAHLRAFVLRPWLDIQPYAVLPGHGCLADLLRSDPVAADLAEVRSRPDLTLESEL
jgi:2-amino-4-hydroxy-6-hydroxymethyldihydropteridine diphosphokinase